MDVNWLYRGAQSALFYYVSCAPLHRRKHIRRRTRENKRDRAAREAYESKQPPHMRYPQADPLKTHEYWDEDIIIGPAPGTNKRATKTRVNAEKRYKRGLESGRNTPVNVPAITIDTTEGVDANEVADVGHAEAQCGSTNVSKSTSLRSQTISRANSRNEHRKFRNHRRWYQRDDEQLDGAVPVEIEGSAVAASQRSRASTRASAGSTRNTLGVAGPAVEPNPIQVPSMAVSREPEGPKVHVGCVHNHQSPITIPLRNYRDKVNDWMFQEPPSPEFMSGKDTVFRSRSGTTNSIGTSSLLTRDSTGSLRRNRMQRDDDLRRQLSARAVEGKLKSGADPFSTFSDIQPQDQLGSTAREFNQIEGFDFANADADDEDNDSTDTEAEEEADSRPSTHDHTRSSSSSDTVNPTTNLTVPIKSPAAVFDPERIIRPPHSLQRSRTSSEAPEESRHMTKRRSYHRKHFTPDTESFLFSCPTPLPDKLREHAEMARQARITWENRARDLGHNGIDWRRFDWSKDSNDTDKYPYSNGPNDSVIVDDQTAEIEVSERRWSAEI